MAKNWIIQYQTRPDAADENARLIEGVFAALAELKPDNFRYTTYRLADDVTFVHVAQLLSGENPLFTLSAFAEFQREIGQRCVAPPAASEATIVGSYGCLATV